MKIVVLVKQVPDTWGERTLDATTGWVDRVSGEQVLDEINERAIEVALAYKDTDKSAEITALTMAPDNVSESLKKALAMGCDAAYHITDNALSGSDALQTAQTLGAALLELSPDLVIAGNASTDGNGGVVPAMIAEILQVPHLSSLGEITITEESVSGTRQREDGVQRVSAPLPGVISINESNPDARFPSFKGIMGAKKKPVTVASLAELKAELPQAHVTLVSTAARPPREAGTKIIDDGTAATQLADFLTTNRLI